MGHALTVGMATYEDFDGVYFTVQSLRAHHGTEFDVVVVDNAPRRCARTRAVVQAARGRYYHRPDLTGTSAPRDAVFHFATTPWVMVVDSHVLLEPGAVTAVHEYARRNPDSRDIHTGPMVYDDGRGFSTHWTQARPPGLWGTWATDPRGAPVLPWGQREMAATIGVPTLSPGRTLADVATVPFEIPMQGLGLWFARQDSWPGFNPLFRGFGGEEGYIHELYRQRGGKALCHPAVRWRHRFRDVGGWANNPVPYPIALEDHVWNLLVGHRELGVEADAAIWEDFGQRLNGGRAVFDRLVREADAAQPRGRVTRRPRQTLLGVWYSNNAAPEKLLRQSLSSVQAAADQSRHEVRVVTCPWERVPGNPFREVLAARRDGPGHLNIVRQMRQCLDAASGEYNAVVCLEHDVLYPPDYFDRVGNAFADNPSAPVVSNLDYIGLNATGWLAVRERHEPMHQLSMRYDVFDRNLNRCEMEATRDGVCLLEPQGDRADWVRLPPKDLSPAVHVNHPKRLTSHGEVVFHPTADKTHHPHWGDFKKYWPLEAQPVATQKCGSCSGPPAPPEYPSIAEWAAKGATADFAGHMGTLAELATGRRCTELSLWLKSADLAMASTAKTFTSVCPSRKPQWAQLEKHLNGKSQFVQADPHAAEIGETDLLFIDTRHTAPATYDLLDKHHGKVTRYIAVHCTTTFGETGDDGGPGVMPGVRRFLQERREWTAIRHDPHTHGLIVLSKSDEDKRQPPGVLRKALNFAKATAKHAADGGQLVSDEVYESRIAHCLTCEHRFHDVCGACGCPVEKKASWASEECGLVKLGLPPKWTAG